ncbi:adenylate kinase-like [Pyrus x bretschneideri]|uniref:adenylate kinase-like n=1 Tax=Pyrus x bretschneideri TaxID=225117 RepID=UPI002030F219|nr:adenylate kinase-like [Pyrus x bretschneideri]XP_048437532.1 adenylate kinase-like [Pyrus x bretschneideri]
MACNASVVHQAMASAIAQPNKAPPPPSCAHLSLSSNSKSKPFKLLRSSQYSFASTFSPSRPQTVVPFCPSRVPNFLYGLVHVAAGDLLRAEIASGSENGRRAREYMEQEKLVPDEIVVMMVKDRLLQPDSHLKKKVGFYMGTLGAHRKQLLLRN